MLSKQFVYTLYSITTYLYNIIVIKEYKKFKYSCKCLLIHKKSYLMGSRIHALLFECMYSSYYDMYVCLYKTNLIKKVDT